jgi:hypothetical protein
MTYDEAIAILTQFCAKIDGLTFSQCEVGVGRPAVALFLDDKILHYNFWTYDSSTGDFISPFPEEMEIDVPDGVNAYHKDNFIAVLIGEGQINIERSVIPLIQALNGENPDTILANMPEEETQDQETLEEAFKQLAIWCLSMKKQQIEIAIYTDTNQSYGPGNSAIPIVVKILE